MMIAKVKCFNQLVMGDTDCTLSPLISFNIDYCTTYSTEVSRHSEMKKRSLIIFIRAARRGTKCLDKRFEDFQSLHIEIFFAVPIYSIGKTGKPRNLCSFPSAI